VNREIGIGMIGCGVVGTGALRLLRDNARSIEARLGGRLVVRRIAARDTTKARDAVVPRELLTDDPQMVLEDPSVDVVVELVGGIEPAGAYVRQALESGKNVVTANKMLLAEQGHELIELAESRGVDLYFEAAVAGGIPIIRVLREALASDRILGLRGIVNGTSNYILSRMRDEGIGFAEALTAAQAAGYAEADPTLDVGGGDAAHKLTILATLAYGARVAPSQIPTEGITEIEAIDIEFAKRFGYVIKLLAVARSLETLSADPAIDRDRGPLDLRVHPALIRDRSVLASVSGALNAVYVQGEALGPCLLSGLGAGSLPTAVSVVSDIVDVGRNVFAGSRGRVPSRAFRGEHLVARPVRDLGEHVGRYYLRFSVLDQPGVLARLAGALGAFDVSIEQMVQLARSTSGEQPVSVVLLTHAARERDVQCALREIALLQHVVERTRMIRIEDV
jgi:homoserine dehydrogenase